MDHMGWPENVKKIANISFGRLYLVVLSIFYPRKVLVGFKLELLGAQPCWFALHH